jgi:hypothetical protein
MKTRGDIAAGFFFAGMLTASDTEVTSAPLSRIVFKRIRVVSMVRRYDDRIMDNIRNARN